MAMPTTGQGSARSNDGQLSRKQEMMLSELLRTALRYLKVGADQVGVCLVIEDIAMMMDHLLKARRYIDYVRGSIELGAAFLSTGGETDLFSQVDHPDLMGAERRVRR